MKLSFHEITPMVIERIHFDFEEISFHNTVFSTNGIINDVDDGIIDVETFSMKDILWYKQVLIWKTEKICRGWMQVIQTS